MAGYTVGVASETKAFKQGIESGVIDPLEDAQKELLALGKSRGPEQLEKAMKDAERATEKLGDETKRTANAIEQEFRDTYRKVKQSSDDGMDGAKRGLDDFKQEAKQTARESAASFDGSAESVVDAFQEVAANAFGGFGAIGTAAGIAAAGGIGLVTAELQRQQEAADEMRRRISAAYQGAAEDGRTFIDTQAVIADGLDLIFNPERAEEYKRVLEDTTQLGLDRATLIAANTGDLEAQSAVQEQINRLLDDANSYELTGSTNKRTLKNDVADLRDRWKEVVTTTQEYADKTVVANNYTSTMLHNLIESAGTATEEVDALNNKLVTIQTENGEMKVFIDAQTGQATENLDRFKGDADGVIDSVNGKEVVLRARSAIDQAQRDIDGFVIRNNGKEIRINARVVTSGGGDWE